ncbi:Uncharacterised protein [Salmonella enterica subsp. enterica serovar Typhi]|nr:Uncharacterised protein [Salmonella enterica subsp. enterica serovar Typhi]CXC87942.1 Uncharacterised protein [Salmonella enterica subsp. enterica serovar Typhi]
MSPAHADWSDDATVIPRRRSTLIRRTRRRGSSPSAALPQSAGTRHTSSVASASQTDGQRRSPECQYGTDSTISPSHACPASGWTTRARYIVRSHSAANCRGRIPWRKYRGRCRKKRRSGTVSFRASRADVDVLRRRVLAKASLIMV